MKKPKEKVPQRDKLKQEIQLRPFPWTEKQKEFLELALHKETKIVFVTGPAGSAKTLLATFAALSLIQEHKISDIIYVRSAVESSDSKLGYLPGEVDDKMAYYGIPFMDKLEELLPKSSIQTLINDERIEIMPVNFIRGQSWNARVALIDEAQNMTQKEIYTLLTRLGKFSKCYILADPTQCDINGKGGGFARLRDHFATEEGAAHGIFQFNLHECDIMRSELVKFLVQKYAELK